MTMDYGPTLDMGAAAIQAANALHTQLGQIWTTKTSAQLWAMEGNTPMIGVNDSSNEVFTTGNASTPGELRRQPTASRSWRSGRSAGTTRAPAARRRATTSSPTSSRRSPAAPAVAAAAVAAPPRSTGTAASASTSPAPTPPTAPRSSSGPATAPTPSSGRTSATRSRRSASAWTSPRPAPPTAPRCSSTTATAPAPRRGPQGANGSLVNTNSGKCLDATGPSSADGTRLQIWTCAGSANQSWTLG